MTAALSIQKKLQNLKNRDKAQILQKFFKTGPGQYGEGDIFLGITVPILRKTAKEHLELSFSELQKLLNSKIHEERLLALLILVLRYPKTDPKEKEETYNFYLKNLKNINNWDLVDLTAPQIVGEYLLKRKKEPLYHLAQSEHLWSRRISIIATFQFIKNHEFNCTLKIAKTLLLDQQDLIQKAVGWMLREIGKRELQAEEQFLKKHYLKMPRTMLRYAIEKFEETKRQQYLKSLI